MRKLALLRSESVKGRRFIRVFIRTGLALQNPDRFLSFVCQEVGLAREESKLQIASLFFVLLKHLYTTDMLLIQEVTMREVVKRPLELSIVTCADKVQYLICEENRVAKLFRDDAALHRLAKRQHKLDLLGNFDV